VLFPFAALGHPPDTADAGGPQFGYETATVDNTGDAGTAHTIQMRMVLSF
jgi:hypothetical protein